MSFLDILQSLNQQSLDEKNVTVSYVKIEDCKLGQYDVLDLRTSECFAIDSIVGSENIAAVTAQQTEELCQLKDTNQIKKATLISFVSKTLSYKLVELVSKKGGRPLLLVCYDGGVISELLATILHHCHCQPFILFGGFQRYRAFVDQHFKDDRYISRRRVES